MNISSKKLINDLNNKDENAFQKVYELEVGKIYRFVLLKVNDESKAREIVQDVFLKLWNYVEKGKKVTSIEGLLYHISRTQIIDYYRSKDYKRSDQVSIDDVSSDELIADDQTERNIDINYDLETVKDALPRLPDIYQEVIILKFVEEKSHREIADILGKEENNVRTISYRALKALKKIINNRSK